MRHWNHRSDIEIAQLAKEEEVQRRRLCEHLVADVDDADVPVEIRLLHGEAAEVIPDYVEKYQTDILVMGTVCRTGLPGFLIGNTAESMLDKVRCSVVTLKPDNFITPVLVSASSG